MTDTSLIDALQIANDEFGPLKASRFRADIERDRHVQKRPHWSLHRSVFQLPEPSRYISPLTISDPKRQADTCRA